MLYNISSGGPIHYTAVRGGTILWSPFPFSSIANDIAVCENGAVLFIDDSSLGIHNSTILRDTYRVHRTRFLLSPLYRDTGRVAICFLPSSCIRIKQRGHSTTPYPLLFM